MRIYSIFQSVDGEVNAFGQGAFTTFVRFVGCNLACKYCDTKYARDSQGQEMSVEEVLQKVKDIGCRKVTITGGEPLYQADELFKLTKRLFHAGYSVSIETNGSYSIQGYGVGSWVVDYKLSTSGMLKFMKEEVHRKLVVNDFVKFVLSNEEDYQEALVVKERLQEAGCHAKFAFSPVYEVLSPAALVEWLSRDKVFDCLVNIQLHKIIWPDCGEGDER